jgi:hypothetical protein
MYERGQPMAHPRRLARTGWLCALIASLLLPLAGPVGASAQRPPQRVVDIDLPSASTGSPDGTLAVRLYLPVVPRYAAGASIAIVGMGGVDSGSLDMQIPPVGSDLLIAVFLFPGGVDPTGERRSDGVYDNRGETSILALRDVILYLAGKLADSEGRLVDDVVDVSLLHDNIGLVGLSNGGNIAVAVAALYGAELRGHLRYIVQWESPVSSSAATRDLGRVVLDKPDRSEDNQRNAQVDLFNPRLVAYDPIALQIDTSDLAYDPANPQVPVFHDGNGDGQFNTVVDPASGLATPDLNLDGALGLDEDFPLTAFFDCDHRRVYSRPITTALAEQGVFGATWPADVLTPAEANAFWDLREAVVLYDQAAANLPELEGMVLVNVRDHVQSHPAKPHIHQAFDGWTRNGLWVQINPSLAYAQSALPPNTSFQGLPDNAPLMPPADWTDHASYCAGTDVPGDAIQLAAIWQMADRAQGETPVR